MAPAPIDVIVRRRRLARIEETRIEDGGGNADTKEARTGDRSGLEAAAASGAQMISTDYYPGAPDPQHFGFVTTLPGGVLQRCNPIRRPAPCALDIEQ